MMTRLVVGMVVAVGVLLVFLPTRSETLVNLSEQNELVGASGGPNMKCLGTSNCGKCTPPAGCTVPLLSYTCNCTSPGLEGCATAVTFNVCAPITGSTSCDQTGGAASCGFLQQPVEPTVVLVAGEWTCPTPKCSAGVAGSAYCSSCI